MKKLIISSLALAVITSCSSSNDSVADDNNNSNDNSPLLLKKFTEITQDNQTYVIEFKYDGDKITEAIDTGENAKTVYTYSGDNIVKTEDYEDGVLREIREFTYSNGRIMAEKVTEKYQGTLVYTKKYQYITDNHIKFTNYGGATYNPSTGTYSNIQYIEEDLYLSSNGNVASRSYTHNGVTYNTTNTYDNANHPMKNVKGFIKINLFMADGETGYNNLLSSSSNYSGIISGTNKSKADHTFNSESYPTKTVMTYTSSVLGTNSHTYLYEYNK
ncbi:hypothetical protein [Chryseobacterium flavum]|uniref:hypothetical protein n=1 Tax=Chryseobacterium flavum TaxID=415851 RepID=UPI002FDABFBD